jgi:nucleotide-binding universal stress UspA family protein
MKILVAVDGSKHSESAVKEVIQRRWPAGTEVHILSVANPLPFMMDPILITTAAHFESQEQEWERASQDVAKFAKQMAENAPELKVSKQVLEGSPKKVITEEAARWGADLIVVGSHGYGPVGQFLLGSVAEAVAVHAPCSVEIVRSQHAATHQ